MATGNGSENYYPWSVWLVGVIFFSGCGFRGGGAPPTVGRGCRHLAFIGSLVSRPEELAARNPGSVP